MYVYIYIYICKYYIFHKINHIFNVQYFINFQMFISLPTWSRKGPITAFTMPVDLVSTGFMMAGRQRGAPDWGNPRDDWCQTYCWWTGTILHQLIYGLSHYSVRVSYAGWQVHQRYDTMVLKSFHFHGGAATNKRRDFCCIFGNDDH